MQLPILAYFLVKPLSEDNRILKIDFSRAFPMCGEGHDDEDDYDDNDNDNDNDNNKGEDDDDHLELFSKNKS